MAKRQMYEVKVFNTFTNQYEVIGYSETEILQPNIKEQLLDSEAKKNVVKDNEALSEYSWNEEYDFDRIVVGNLVKTEIELPLTTTQKIKFTSKLQIKKGDKVESFSGFKGFIQKYSSNSYIEVISHESQEIKVFTKDDIKEIITEE